MKCVIGFGDGSRAFLTLWGKQCDRMANDIKNGTINTKTAYTLTRPKFLQRYKNTKNTNYVEDETVGRQFEVNVDTASKWTPIEGFEYEAYRAEVMKMAIEKAENSWAEVEPQSKKFTELEHGDRGLKGIAKVMTPWFNVGTTENPKFVAKVSDEKGSVIELSCKEDVQGRFPIDSYIAYKDGLAQLFSTSMFL
jgi:hypothetical protein